MKEIWKNVIGYEGLYEVSNLGNVKSLRNDKNKKDKLIKLSLDSRGYLGFNPSKLGIQKTKKVHIAVSESFLNHIPDGYKLVINHKNNDKKDNNVNNLEIVTNRENSNKKHLKSSSQYVGVSYNKNQKSFKSVIYVNGKNKFIGYFKNEIDAHNAYQKELLKI